MPLTLEQYASYLDTRDLSWPAPPTLCAPRARPHLVAMPQVRVVTWNVYGTLLAISTGGLVFEPPQPGDRGAHRADVILPGAAYT